MISTTILEPLTIDALNALLANFSTGIISLDELWASITEAEELQCFRNSMPSSASFPESIKNRISNNEAGFGI